MSRIIEIWKRPGAAAMPVRFTVGSPPECADGSVIGAELIVSSIEYRETGAAFGKRLSGPMFCVNFENTFVQRFIPENEVIDTAYETAKSDEVKVPALEA